MKTTPIVLLLLAAYSAFIPCAVSEDNATEKVSRESTEAFDPDSVPPPTPYENEIIDAVFARFPGVNRREVDKFLKANFEDELQKFRTLAITHHVEATDLFSTLVREVLSLLETRRKNPVAYEKKLVLKRLESRAGRLVREIRMAGESDKKRIQQALCETAASIFDIKQQLMKIDVEQMSRELALLRELVDKREANRETIVGRRVTDLVGDKKDLEW
ncbi:MAG: hypothetical protein WCN95_02685 [bacterium]